MISAWQSKALGLLLPSALLLLLPSQNVEALSVTPVEKVISLLEDLKTEVVTEGKTEAETYDAFACFCKDTTTAKSTAITEGQDSIETLSASIAENIALKDEKATELSDRKTKQEEYTKQLDETTARCQQEAASFEAELADITKAILSMERAIKVLKASKPAFLQRDALREASSTLELAKALGLTMPMAPNRALQAFLQQGVDPSDPSYKFKSGGIIEVLEKLNTEFTSKKSTTEDEFAASKKGCEDLQSSLSGQMTTNGAAMDTLKSDMDGLATAVASDREELVSAEAVLKDDQLYLKDLTERCESAAKVWDQRSASRAEELKALEEALAVLKEGSDERQSVKELDAVNKRALLVATKQQATPPAAKKASSFLQLRRASQKLLSNEKKKSATVNKGPVAAQKFLQEQASKLASKPLSTLATQIAADPFAKVKQLIQSLIQRLLAEATDEATKKGFCDTELGKAKKDREHRSAEASKLTAEITELEAKKGTLEGTVSEIKEALPELRQSLKEAGDLREKEKDENEESIKLAKEGVAAVKEAISILKVYYTKAQYAKALIQASPVDEDTSGPGFKTSYKGKQSSAEGIIGLLETIQSDFARTVKMTQQAEKESQAAYVEFEQTSKSDISAKETSQKLSEEDLESLGIAMEQKTSDLETAQKLVDAALKAIEDLKPMCIDNGMTYAERVEKREEEIAALKSALCILDTEGVEKEC